MQRPVSVLVVDDSALMRNLIGRIVEGSPDLVLAGKAMNGKFALQKIERLNPDLVILDLEMPEMNGIEFLVERRKRNIAIPVVILSSVAHKGAHITMEALSLGASDFILKPSGSISEDIHLVAATVTGMALAYGRQYQKIKPEHLVAATEIDKTVRPGVPPVISRESAKEEPREEWKAITPKRNAGRIELVAIGISTGGPNALRKMLPEIAADFPVPILVVQHMPAGFTEEFAKSLSRICDLDVREAADGDIVKPGRILIAPGDRHLEVEKKYSTVVARVSEMPAVNGHRPSVDVLFSSAARHYENNVMAVLMTGMGKDGARGLGMIYREGGVTLAQDQDSSVVFGMPRVAIENGYVHKVVPLAEMADTIMELAKNPVKNPVKNPAMNPPGPNRDTDG